MTWKCFSGAKNLNLTQPGLGHYFRQLRNKRMKERS
jgi:hypothetical protein